MKNSLWFTISNYTRSIVIFSQIKPSYKQQNTTTETSGSGVNTMRSEAIYLRVGGFYVGKDHDWWVTQVTPNRAKVSGRRCEQCQNFWYGINDNFITTIMKMRHHYLFGPLAHSAAILSYPTAVSIHFHGTTVKYREICLFILVSRFQKRSISSIVLLQVCERKDLVNSKKR